jgi:hypothetical protein
MAYSEGLSGFNSTWPTQHTKEMASREKIDGKRARDGIHVSTCRMTQHRELIGA